MRTNFQSYLALLTQAVSFQPFVAANAIFADPTILQDVQTRIADQGPDVVLTQAFSDVMASGGIVGTKFSVDNLNRRIDVASGALSMGGDQAIFNAQTPVPLEVYAWFLASDSTILPTAIQVQYRLNVSDPWHVLNPIDSLQVPGGSLQLSIFLPTMLGSPAFLTKLYVLARQL